MQAVREVGERDTELA